MNISDIIKEESSIVNVSLIAPSCESIYTAKLRGIRLRLSAQYWSVQVANCHKSFCTVVYMLVHNHKSLCTTWELPEDEGCVTILANHVLFLRTKCIFWECTCLETCCEAY